MKNPTFQFRQLVALLSVVVVGLIVTGCDNVLGWCADQLRTRPTRLALVAVLLGAGPLLAQDRPIELGIDVIQLSVTPGESVHGRTQVDIPLALVRVGFPISDHAFLEPGVSLDIQSGGGLTELTSRLQLGALIHFGSSGGRSGLFVHPNAGLLFISDRNGDYSRQFNLGLLVGSKIPLVEKLVARIQGGVFYGFEHDGFDGSFTLAASFGFSFFTK